MQKGFINRKTGETEIQLKLVLHGEGKFSGNSGIGFLDHMLHQIARHGGVDITYQCVGDLDVDTHHMVEDLGICLGKAINDALGDKKGIRRYGVSYVPMDEALARVVMDISGRAFLGWRASFTTDRVGALETECVKEFFRAVVQQGGITLHIDLLEGENTHHSIEAIFKAFGRALKEAVTIEGSEILSTKGILD